MQFLGRRPCDAQKVLDLVVIFHRAAVMDGGRIKQAFRRLP